MCLQKGIGVGGGVEEVAHVVRKDEIGVRVVEGSRTGVALHPRLDTSQIGGEDALAESGLLT